MASAVQPLPDGSGGSRPRRCATCGERFPDDYRLCPKDGTPIHSGTPPSDPLLGTVLAGTYRIRRFLGRGGMGRLYEAEHVRIDRRFAAKVLSEAHADRPEQVARFEREARALAPLGSPHVLHVVDVVRTPDGRPCLVTDLLEGEDLSRRLGREHRLPVSEALSIARQMCRGLEVTHAHGVIHRDLKPSNVFLASAGDASPSVRLLDFGVAKLLGAPDLTRSDAVVGTPSYMAPEQARGATHAGEAADVYGVGAVLYHMLSGQAPYPPEEPHSVLARVLSEEPRRLRAVAPEVPEEVEAVVQAAMARDPAERVHTARELRTLLAELEPGQADSREGESLPGSTASDLSDTQVLPSGIGSDTSALARRAARARPILALLVGLAGVAAGLAVAVGLALLLRGLGVPDAQGAGLWVVRLGATAAGLATVAGLARRVRGRWRSAVAVETVRRRLARALGTGAAWLGATLGLAAGLATVGQGYAPLALPSFAGHLALAALATGIAWSVRPPRLG